MEHTENKTIIHDTEKTASWEQQTAMKVSGISILVNLLLSVFKLIAGIVAHSGAMISDAIHSASDVGSTFIVIIGVRLSTKNRTKSTSTDMKEWSVFLPLSLQECCLSLVSGSELPVLVIYVKSTSGGTIAIPGTLALIAAVVSIVVKEWMFWYTRGAAKKINSGALMADAWHHRSDALSSIGAFVGIFGARLGYPILDPIASIVICVMIAKASIDIFRDAIDKMVDHSCDAKMEESMKREILKVPGVRRVDLLKTRLFGSKMYVDIEIAADGNIPFLMHMILRKMYIIRSRINSKM